MQETEVRSLGAEDPLEKEMATHSSTFAWEIPRTEEPDGLQSMGSQKSGHDLATKQQQHTHVHVCVPVCVYSHTPKMATGPLLSVVSRGTCASPGPFTLSRSSEMLQPLSTSVSSGRRALCRDPRRSAGLALSWPARHLVSQR